MDDMTVSKAKRLVQVVLSVLFKYVLSQLIRRSGFGRFRDNVLIFLRLPNSLTTAGVIFGFAGEVGSRDGFEPVLT